MLVLSRKPTERIRIGDDITVVIVRVSGGRVRVGIEAPRHIRVMRDDPDESFADPETGKPDRECVAA